MPTDNLARKISIGYEGGSLTATRGAMEALFGPALVEYQEDQTVGVAVRSHARRRVIGGPITSVAGHNYQRKRYPQGPAGGNSGGEPIAVLIQGSWWTMRLTGSHQSFNRFLRNATWQSGAVIFWKSEKGTPYGPFGQAVTP